MPAGRAHGRSGTKKIVATMAIVRDDERDPEEPVVVEVVEDQPGEHDPEPAADAEQAGHQADRAGDALVAGTRRG